MLTKRYLSESLSPCRVNEALFTKVSIVLACQQKPYLPESRFPWRVNEALFAKVSIALVCQQNGICPSLYRRVALTKQYLLKAVYWRLLNNVA
ncbi:MAG: hypothetical protein JNK57_01620 [Planctomycetaceae bacterium]|nr:hypothetical protein [Planctomycetaceae bacterium]